MLEFEDMTTKLKAKQPEASTPSRPKILLFGEAGVGKTWGALDFPGVYYIDTEGGAKEAHYIAKLKASGGSYMGPEDGALDFSTVVSQLQALATEKHNFKTVVIDSFSKLFNTAISHEAERLEQEGTKNEFARDKKPAVKMTQRLIMWADRMDVNLILVCHSKPKWTTDAKGQRSEVGQTFDGYDKLDYELGLALQITKKGASRYAQVRKSRLESFQDAESFEWSYAKFAEKFGRERIEAAVVPIQIATVLQVEEIKRLLSAVKIPEGELEKLLSKAKASSIEELSEKDATHLIEYLKKKTA